MALTVKRVKQLIRNGVPRKHTDGAKGGGVKGLMLVIESETSAHWEQRFQINKKTYWMGLGSALDVAREDGEAGTRLAAVRKRALHVRDQIAAGINPLEMKRSERERQKAVGARRLTFKEAAERCHEALEPGWSNAHHAHEFISSLRRWVYPHIGSLEVAAVGKDEVLRVLEQKLPDQEGTFWTVRSQTADRTRNRVERVLDWAEARGFRPEGTPNPARWKGFLDQLLPQPRKIAPIKNMAAVPYDEVPALMAVLAGDPTVGAQVVRFVVMTSCRLGEALKATWAEIDLDTGEWVIAAARMKGRREHRVPLSPQAVELLKGLCREESNPYVFISGRTPGGHLSEFSVTEALRRGGCKRTLHGMRSAFSDWSHERTSFPGIIVELSLAHRVGTAVENAYRRTDLFAKRRKLMEAWARFVTSPPVEKQKGEKIVSLRA